MILPKWLGSASEELIEIKIPANHVMVVLLSHTISQCSVATVISPEQIKGLVEDPELFKTWIHSIENRITGENSFRLFGNENLFSKLIDLFKSKNLQEGKHHPVKTVQTSVFYFLPQEGRVRAPKGEAAPLAAAPLRSTVEAPSRKIKVLVVDDSETIRKLLTKMFNDDPQTECVGAIHSPNLAMEAIANLRPDVITLDIHMPEMNGVTLLKKILAKYTLPVVMISALSKEDGTDVLEALEAGAVDYIQKPSLSEAIAFAPIICEKIKNARQAKIRNQSDIAARASRPTRILSSEGVDLSYLICIGSSTGGTEALKTVLTKLPERIPPILIVQHIPAVFSKAFAERMDQLCKFEVKEAEDGDIVAESRVLIAPGGKQMGVREVRGDLKIVIEDSPPVNRHKPSVDFLFDSIAGLNRKKITAAILTGMGSDGAKGLLKLKQQGAKTFAQDEATSVVYGMPKEAMKMGGADKSVPIDEIAENLLQACMRQTKKGAA